MNLLLILCLIGVPESPDGMPAIRNLPYQEVRSGLAVGWISEDGSVAFTPGYTDTRGRSPARRMSLLSGLREEDRIVWDPVLNFHEGQILVGRHGVAVGETIAKAPPLVSLPNQKTAHENAFLFSPDGDEWIVYWSEAWHGGRWFGLSRLRTAPGPFRTGTLYAATLLPSTEVLLGMDLATARPILVRMPDRVVLYPPDADYRWALPALDRRSKGFRVDSTTRRTYLRSGHVAEAYRQPQPVLGFEVDATSDQDTFLLGNGERCDPYGIHLHAVLPDGRLLVTLQAKYPDGPGHDLNRVTDFETNRLGPVTLVSRLDGPQAGDLFPGWQVVGMFDIHATSLRGNWLGVTWLGLDPSSSPPMDRQWHALVHLDLPTVEFPPMPEPVFAWPPYREW